MGRKKVLKTYWGKKGNFQKDYNRIEKLQLVPPEGRSDCLEGELLRSASSLYYDFYNNGCMNNRSGNWLFLVKHSDLLKLNFSDLERIKDHSCGLRGDPNNDLGLAEAYEKIIDSVITFITKQEVKAKKAALKKKEKLSAKHFTPNTEDSLDGSLPDYEYPEEQGFFGDDFDEDDEFDLEDDDNSGDLQDEEEEEFR